MQKAIPNTIKKDAENTSAFAQSVDAFKCPSFHPNSNFF
jgi:hypothetical protein